MERIYDIYVNDELVAQNVSIEEDKANAEDYVLSLIMSHESPEIIDAIEKGADVKFVEQTEPDELVKVQKVVNEVLPKMLELDSVCVFKSVLGMITDCWAAEKGLTIEETLDIFESLAVVQKQVHAIMGWEGARA
jgi:hypothetical protein